MNNRFDIVAMGGSMGSIAVVIQILDALPKVFPVPIVIVIHRMKNVESNLKTILSHTRKIKEPEDKEEIKGNMIYLAPQNYHLLIEQDRTFSMDYSELVNYSRPSIDVAFTSISNVYRSKTLGILLSGANKDGAEGINRIIKNGGRGIAQDPATAECDIMPMAAIKNNEQTEIKTPINIVDILLGIN